MRPVTGAEAQPERTRSSSVRPGQSACNATMSRQRPRNPVNRHDRIIGQYPLSTRGIGEILEGGGVQPIRLPPKSPNLNAYAERFVRSIQGECLSRVVPLGEGHLRLLVGEYVDHDHRERNHQGLDNQLLQRPPPPVSLAADVQRRERLGGWLNFYHREAA